jgi:hypothetical protein
MTTPDGSRAGMATNSKLGSQMSFLASKQKGVLSKDVVLSHRNVIFLKHLL